MIDVTKEQRKKSRQLKWKKEKKIICKVEA